MDVTASGRLVAVLVGTAIASVLLGLWRTAPFLPHGDADPFHELHWLVYGYDRVWYRDRTYVGPETVPLARLRAEYGPLTPTGERVVGLAVLAPRAADRPPYRTGPTVLILRENARDALVYSLSGGP